MRPRLTTRIFRTGGRWRSSAAAGFPGRSATFGPATPHRNTCRKEGKADTVAVLLAALVLAGSLYGLWELLARTGPSAPVPLSRSERHPDPGPSVSAPLELPDGSTRSQTSPGHDARPTGDARPAEPGSGEGWATPPGTTHDPLGTPSSGPELRLELGRVARTFRTSTPDLRGLNTLLRSLAARSRVLPPSLERSEDRISGRVLLEDTDLEASFEVQGGRYTVSFRESSYETVRPPFLHLELTVTFETGGRQLAATSATLAFAPNPERRSLEHMGIGEELRVGWKVHFGPAGASARAIGARVAANLDDWNVGPSEQTRKDKRVRDLSSFQAWRALLPRLAD